MIFIQKSRHSGIVYNFINTYTIFTVLQIMLKFVYDISIEWLLLVICWWRLLLCTSHLEHWLRSCILYIHTYTFKM